jgi:hypothetical protein
MAESCVAASAGLVVCAACVVCAGSTVSSDKDRSVAALETDVVRSEAGDDMALPICIANPSSLVGLSTLSTQAG